MDDLLNFSVPEEEEDEDEGGEDVQPPRNITRRKTGLRQTDTFGLFNTDDPVSLKPKEKKNPATCSSRGVIKNIYWTRPS